MSRHWREQLDPNRHSDHMNTRIGGLPVDPPRDRLVEKWVYFVEVTSFTFQFQSVDQLQQCLEYFKQKIHPTSRLHGVDLEHHWQRWFERLPQWLFEESKRVKVVTALQYAAKDFSKLSAG